MTGISMLVLLAEASQASLFIFRLLLLPSDGLLEWPLTPTGLKSTCCVQLLILRILVFLLLTTNTSLLSLFIISAGHKSSGRMCLHDVTLTTPPLILRLPPDLFKSDSLKEVSFLRIHHPLVTQHQYSHILHSISGGCNSNLGVSHATPMWNGQDISESGVRGKSTV